MPNLDQEFNARAIQHLRGEYLPRIEAALRSLAQEHLWWRPHGRSNSVGNLLLHLEGNVRQWILHGLGGEADQRLRDGEFAAREGADAAQLFAALQVTVLAACAVIDGLDAEDLLQERRIQGRNCTALAAVLHVVEHFSWHTGQIVWIAKERGGESHGLAFYDDRLLHEAAAGRKKPENPGSITR
jgi:uncharacterized damage-inducible protein DinB